MKFVPFRIKSIVNDLSENDKNLIMDFLDKLISSRGLKGTYCGHCNALIQCDGPCELNAIRSYSCCPLCYDCYKGDWDAPCPKNK